MSTPNKKKRLEVNNFEIRQNKTIEKSEDRSKMLNFCLASPKIFKFEETPSK